MNRPVFVRGALAAILIAAQTSVCAAGTGRFVTFGYTVSDEAEFDGQANARVELKETRLVLGLLPGISAERGLDLGVDYQYTRYSFADVDSRNRDLHRLQVPIGWRAPLGGWQLDAVIAPGIATSSNVFKDLFDNGSGDDLFATARAEFTRYRSGRPAWIVGLAWDRSFGKPLVYPVAGVAIAPNERWRIRLAVPDPELRFTATDRQTVRLRLYPAGFEWHVLDDDFITEFDYRVEAWRAEAWWSVRAWSSVYVDLSVGYEFGRRHEFTDRTGMRIERDVDDALLLTIGLRWRDGPPAPTHRVARACAR